MEPAEQAQNTCKNAAEISQPLPVSLCVRLNPFIGSYLNIKTDCFNFLKFLNFSLFVANNMARWWIYCNMFFCQLKQFSSTEKLPVLNEMWGGEKFSPPKNMHNHISFQRLQPVSLPPTGEKSKSKREGKNGWKSSKSEKRRQSAMYSCTVAAIVTAPQTQKKGN